MIPKNKTLLMKISVVAFIALFLFACRGDSSQSNQTLTQGDQTQKLPPSMENNTVNENHDEETVDTAQKTVVSENNETDSTKKKYEWIDDNGRITTLEYRDVEVKPLLNGNKGEEEWLKYLTENNKLLEIAKENGIQDFRIFYQFFIDVDGAVIDATIRESTHPLLSAEILRLINATQGKWTPGKHDGEVLKVRLAASFSVRNN